MISNYNLSCDYHNFELKDKIYLIPDYALKVIYTDGFNEVVFSGNSANVTILEGYDISFQEETSFDERFKFSKSVSIKVNGYKTFNDLDYRYCVVLETKEGEFYLVNVDFPSYVTHTYTLNNGTNSTELVFSSQSNIATLKLTNFNPNNVNSCKQYSNAKIKNVKLTEAWASYLSTWQKSLVNKGEFVDIEPLPDSISLTEEFDGEKYTVTLGFDVPMSYYKNDWHLKLLNFEENKYRGYISLEDGNKAFVGYNVGLFPSYTINGDIISIRLTETAIRGIAYGNDYAIIDTNIPNSIEFSGATCHSYNFESSCDWEVEDKPNYITITPTSGQADTQYELTICNTDDETGYAVSEFVISTCNAVIKPEVVIKNPIYRYTATTETVCSEITNERWVESGTTCTGTHGVDKWVNSVKQISYDDGETWYNSGVESATTLIETNSPDCGYAERWVESGTTCVGYDKYTNSIKQVSYNSGSTWNNTGIESATTLIEVNSEDCGYSPLYENRYFTIVALEDADRIEVIDAYKQNQNRILYSRDSGNTWSHLEGVGDNSVENIKSGESILFKSSGAISAATNGVVHFEVYDEASPIDHIPKRINVEGNVLSLVYGDNFSGQTSIPLSSCFSELLLGTKVVSAANLKLVAETLTAGCYHSMFADCITLTAAPELPALNLSNAYGCYESMFSGCTSLTTLPELPATSLGSSYAHMFRGCTSLTTIPSNYLPVSNLSGASYCYVGMFANCTSLTTIPSNLLPATSLDTGGYQGGECVYEQMFSGCTSLTTIPNGLLPATTLGNRCYAGMFANCTSLTNVPNGLLPATTAKSQCYMGMFSGCTSLTTPPELPATTLDGGCYCGMFRGCTNLETAPILSAKTLVGNPYIGCYQSMFGGCKYINSITCLAESGSSSGNCSGWLAGVSKTGTFIKSPNVGAGAYEYWSISVSGVPSGWDVVDYPAPDYGFKYKLTLNNSKIISSICVDETSQYITSGEVASQYSGTVVSAEIGECVTNIDNSSFYFCSGLTSVTIPGSVTYIGDYAFYDCTGLTSITCYAATPPSLGQYAFNGSTCPIYVPAESVNAYKTAFRWYNYSSRIQPIT